MQSGSLLDKSNSMQHELLHLHSVRLAMDSPQGVDQHQARNVLSECWPGIALIATVIMAHAAGLFAVSATLLVTLRANATLMVTLCANATLMVTLCAWACGVVS
jgi:hypothetical protein